MKALKCRRFPFGKISSASGFSMVELLVVLAIGLILATLSFLSIGGVSGSRALVSGGNQVVDLVNEARQNSISKGTLTALIMVSSSGNSQLDNRAFILANLVSSGTTLAWTPISKWEILPQGVVVSTSLSSFTNPSTAPSNISSLFSLQCQGTSIASTAVLYEVFFPDGHLLPNSASTTPVIYLVLGVQPGGNYYEITLNPYTGIPKVDRP
jgi:prepilin-type N-terminal cleavage/methylation domain-containing protein